MLRRASLFALCLVAAACGRRGPGTPVLPLGPEHYVIAPDDVPAAGQHIRYAAPAPGRAGGLDIAVTRYTAAAGGPDVLLFGVVHIADAPYFEAVRAELDTYGTVLYEGVKPEHQDNEAWQRSFTEQGGEAAAMQRTLAGWFGFAYQLDAIDYTRPHFVHADMTMEAFLAAGGADFLPQLKQPEPSAHGADAPVGSDDTDETEGDPEAAVESAPAEPGGLSPAVRKTWEIAKGWGDMALSRPGPLRSGARRMFAETLGGTDLGHALAMRPGFSELILIRRNEVVIEHLKAALPSRPGPLAIFYGAAHMPDLEERLTTELGYARADAHWLRAWAIRPPLR
ncbi:MAG: hypothetical protein O2894_10450 [Planctomycetota bacterium]|nr:hypothetical protein [Planctomycetota bacterium]